MQDNLLRNEDVFLRNDAKDTKDLIVRSDETMKTKGHLYLVSDNDI